MTIAWPAVYRDASGEVRSSLLNDGEHLSLTLRGIEFHGASLDDWAPVEVDDPERLRSFTLHRGALCSYTLTMAIPVPVLAGGVEKPGILEATLTLGGPAPSGRLDRENLKLAMDLDGRRISSMGLTGWFEDELLDLQDKLPEGTHLKACITCAWSDYSPAGMGLFGGLACFRGNKEGYRKVDSKEDLLAIWKTLTRFVQETYLCPEYEQRRPGTGYRG
jgi:hypothetical protein